MLDAPARSPSARRRTCSRCFDGVLVTPTTRSALPGITRRTIIELAVEAGIPVEERDLWPMELYVADGAVRDRLGRRHRPDRRGRRQPRRDRGRPGRAALAEGYRARTRDPRYLVSVAERVAA